MFAGHAGLALLAKGIRPRVHVAVLVLLTFAPDWIQGILAALGHTNRALSHSLVSVGAGAILSALVYFAARRNTADAAAVGLTYASHWPADFITAIKPTWPGGPEVGLRLYEHVMADFIVESVVVLVCWLVYGRSLAPNGRGRRFAFVIPLGLIAAQVVFAIVQERSCCSA